MKNPFFTCSGATARLVLAAFLHICVASGVSAQTIVVPNSLAEVDGNSVALAPDGHVAEVRFLHIYDASQFSALSGPAFLTQFAYRPNGIPGPSGPITESVRISGQCDRGSTAKVLSRRRAKL